MELREGYKQTEIGVIPVDWDIRALIELGEFKNGINKGKEDFGFGYPFVNLMDVFGIPKISSNENLGLINSTHIDRGIYDLKKGDVIFVRSSVKPEGVGLTTLVSKSLPDTVYSGFLIRFRDNGEIADEFKEFCFHDFGFRNRLIANSTVSANTNINQDSLKALLLVLPKSKDEQQAIAAALSDVDALLTSLDALIAKKRLIKQGAMQELLTGKRRLKGFSGEWEVKKMSDIAVYYSGGTPSTEIADYYNGEIPWITSSDLNKTFIDDVEGRITRLGLENSSAKMVTQNTLLIALYGATAGVTALTRIRAAINQAVLAVIPYSDSFLFLFYKLSYLKDWIIKTYTQGGQPNLSGEIVKSIEISVPEKTEQIAIAEILSDMDAEIAAIESRREKTRLLKQGMMQELLTGRIRLL